MMYKKLLIILMAVLITAIMAAIPGNADSQSADLSLNQKVAQLDMNQAALKDVIKIFGEPEKYMWGDNTFSQKKLPLTYIAIYSDFGIFFYKGHIMELRFFKPDYIFKESIRVGSTLDTALEVLGAPARTVTSEKNGFEDGVLYKDVDGVNGRGYYALKNEKVRIFFEADKIVALYLTSDFYYSEIQKLRNKTGKTIGINKYDDVRQVDLGKIDFTRQDDLVATLWFSQQTKWPDSVKKLKKGNPERFLQAAMDPGLGVRKIHRQGITGKGVSVAIIDQPLYSDHPEFAGKIAAYQDMGCNSESSMHGPAVTSLLAGNKTGTAPGVTIYYAAAPSWLGDAAYYAKAIDWIIDKNRELPKEQKIRVVSVSAAPSGDGSPFTKNNQMWDEACERADKEGILVLDCTAHRGIIGPCQYNLDNPNKLAKCQPGFPGNGAGTWRDSNKILAPTSPRTSAEEYQQGAFSYQYTGRGGLSWAIPYVAGVLALGWQVCPGLTPDQIKDLLFKSAYIKDKNYKIINPQGFVNLVKKFKRDQK